MIKDYFEFETLVEDEGNDKYLILIIYDISDNKHRLEISKLLEGYGTRIQKSAFEAWLTKKHFEKLLSKLKEMTRATDNIRIYKLHGYGEVTVLGDQNYVNGDDVIII